MDVPMDDGFVQIDLALNTMEGYCLMFRDRQYGAPKRTKQRARFYRRRK